MIVRMAAIKMTPSVGHNAVSDRTRSGADFRRRSPRYDPVIAPRSHPVCPRSLRQYRMVPQANAYALR